jgi:hypothetical protein
MQLYKNTKKNYSLLKESKVSRLCRRYNKRRRAEKFKNINYAKNLSKDFHQLTDIFKHGWL